MKFQVKALRDPEGVVSVLLDAADEADAERQAQANGLAVLSLRRAVAWNLDFFKRGSRFPLASFAQELLALLEAGLTMVESIEALAEKESNGPTRATLEHLTSQLRQGRTLSHAMQDLQAAFPALFVASVRATEKTGDLPDALRRYLGYQAQVELVRKKIVSASIYPVLLMGVGLLVLLFLLGYVVPKFSQVYEDIQGNLPLMSQLLLMLGKFLDANGFAVAVVGHRRRCTRRAAGIQSRRARLAWRETLAHPGHWQPHAAVSTGALLSDARHAAARRHAGRDSP